MAAPACCREVSAFDASWEMGWAKIRNIDHVKANDGPHGHTLPSL